MLQDIFPYELKNHYSPHISAKKGDIIFGFDDGHAILKDQDHFFQLEDIPKVEDKIYLFSMNGRNYFLGNLNQYPHETMPVHQLRNFQPQYLAFASFTAYHLFQWYDSHQRCGKCGHKTQLDNKERALRCPNCHHMVYPTISPAIIVAIINQKGELLVTKYAHGPYQKYALVAGYCEIGETAEDTVKREAFEETGLRLKNLVYFNSQPWGISSSLLFGYFAQVDGEDSITLDENELKLAQWVNQDEEIDTNGFSSLTGEMVRLYKSGEYKKFFQDL